MTRDEKQNQDSNKDAASSRTDRSNQYGQSQNRPSDADDTAGKNVDADEQDFSR